jgi:hypothetical protein
MIQKAVPLLLLLLLTSAAVGDPVCPCYPTSYEWIVTPCDTWNCAVSAMIDANGNPFVMPMPTNASKYPWVVVRRVVAGAVVMPDNAPFRVERFDSVTLASARFTTIEPDHMPFMMTAPDGTSVVVFLRDPDTRHRAVR